MLLLFADESYEAFGSLSSRLWEGYLLANLRPENRLVHNTCGEHYHHHQLFFL